MKEVNRSCSVNYMENINHISDWNNSNINSRWMTLEAVLDGDETTNSLCEVECTATSAGLEGIGIENNPKAGTISCSLLLKNYGWTAQQVP